QHAFGIGGVAGRVAYLVFHLHRLGEGAQVQADDGPLHPQAGLVDDALVGAFGMDHGLRPAWPPWSAPPRRSAACRTERAGTRWGHAHWNAAPARRTP